MEVIQKKKKKKSKYTSTKTTTKHKGRYQELKRQKDHYKTNEQTINKTKIANSLTEKLF